MAWDHKYRLLQEGEIVREGDEAQNDDGTWGPARAIGRIVADPKFTAHQWYRRLKTH